MVGVILSGSWYGRPMDAHRSRASNVSPIVVLLPSAGVGVGAAVTDDPTPTPIRIE
jgi:hypothetical protein